MVTALDCRFGLPTNLADGELLVFVPVLLWARRKGWRRGRVLVARRTFLPTGCDRIYRVAALLLVTIVCDEDRGAITRASLRQRWTHDLVIQALSHQRLRSLPRCRSDGSSVSVSPSSLVNCTMQRGFFSSPSTFRVPVHFGYALQPQKRV